MSFVCRGLLLGLLFAAVPSARAGDISHSRISFGFPEEEDGFDRHSIRPSLPGIDIPNPGMRHWLKRVGAIIRADADDNHYINDANRAQYEWEFEQVEHGEWPIVFITKAGTTEIVAILVYAVRRSWNELLPFQRRFPSRAHLWSDLKPRLRPVMGTSQYRRWFKYPELQMPRNRAQLDGLLTMRPWGDGDIAEVKFLTITGRHQLKMVQALIDGTIDHELARFGRIELTPEEQQWIWLEGTGLAGAEFQRLAPNLSFDFSDLGPDSEFKELASHLSRYFRENFYSERWQPVARISELYIQVSGPARQQTEETARRKRFIRSFGFPPNPEWTFVETKEEGTEGIRTDIFKLSVSEFERTVSATLTARTGIDMERDIVYVEDRCHQLLTTVEASAHQAVGR